METPEEQDLRAHLEEFYLDVRSVQSIEFSELAPEFQDFTIWKRKLREAEEDEDAEGIHLARSILRPYYLDNRRNSYGGKLLIHSYPEWLWDEETAARYQPKHCSKEAKLCLHPFCPTA